jgi:hypothetical protein
MWISIPKASEAALSNRDLYTLVSIKYYMAIEMRMSVPMSPTMGKRILFNEFDLHTPVFLESTIPFL